LLPVGTVLEGADGLLAYLHRKRRCVFDSVREIEEKHRKLLTQRHARGAKLQYRGRWLMLDVRPGDADAVTIVCRSKFNVTVPRDVEGIARLEAIRSAFDAWLRERALRDLLRFGRRREAALNCRRPLYVDHLTPNRPRTRDHRWATNKGPPNAS
jgi:hypothetical protein